MSTPLVTALKAIAATLVAVFALLFGVGAYAGFMASPVEQLCTGLAMGTPVADVARQAGERGLSGDLAAPTQDGELTLHNDLPSTLRASCVVVVERGVVATTRFVAPR